MVRVLARVGKDKFHLRQDFSTEVQIGAGA